MAEVWSDEELLARLAVALAAAKDVPPEFVAAARAAFTMDDIDIELAQLVYDSHLHPEPQSLTRAEPACLRTLTFVSSGLTIELEVTELQLLGQLVPPQEAEVRVQERSGQDAVRTTDKVGFFTIQPIPAEPFRLHCRTPGGLNVLTTWITL
ncbi:hypothetical protein ACFFMN_12625 [Planobispora siamensis]|uniref:Uncharacterized protein n=1 Tax=Planobispora siamensis TaxID=936338 RepID=A0A8J3SC14_9ACTN|nr:hypothetical protein [Planobispora siamensis]GIH89800.1 hypothetical protein Psi01_04300 [Planobispora siamensis]